MNTWTGNMLFGFERSGLFTQFECLNEEIVRRVPTVRALPPGKLSSVSALYSQMRCRQRVHHVDRHSTHCVDGKDNVYASRFYQQWLKRNILTIQRTINYSEVVLLAVKKRTST
jgi:hypothetical protein